MSQTLETNLMPEPINGRDKLLKLAEAASPTKNKKKSPNKHNHHSKRSHSKDSKCDLSFTENIEHLVNKSAASPRSSTPTFGDHHSTSSKVSSRDSTSPLDLRISDLRICDSSMPNNDLKSRIPQPIFRPKLNNNIHHHQPRLNDNLSKQQSQIPVASLESTSIRISKTGATESDSKESRATALNESFIPIYKPPSAAAAAALRNNDFDGANHKSTANSSTNNYSFTNFAFCHDNNRRYSHTDFVESNARHDLSHQSHQHFFKNTSLSSSTKSSHRIVKSRSHNTFKSSRDSARSRLRSDYHALSPPKFMASTDLSSPSNSLRMLNSSQNFRRMLNRLDTFYVLDEEGFANSPKKIANRNSARKNVKQHSLDIMSEQSLFDSPFLKESQKSALFQINDLCDKHDDGLNRALKSSSCENLDDYKFVTLNKPKSETNLVVNKNNLAGISHLESDAPESVFNRFRKSFSLHFARHSPVRNRLDTEEKQIKIDKMANTIDINQNICVFPNKLYANDHHHKPRADSLEKKSPLIDTKISGSLKRSHSQPNDKSDDSNSEQCEVNSDQTEELNAKMDDITNGGEVIYAEAIWDHLGTESEELSFHAGDLITVTDTSHKQWWWGAINKDTKFGWFPASYVRLKVSQEETLEEALANPQQDVGQTPKKRMSLSKLSSEQVRANVVLEIVNTERDFVKNLKDVIDGYLKPCRDRQEMFSETRITTIFGNIEQLYEFQSKFMCELEKCIAWENLSHSQIGNCFLNHEKAFSVYADFCKNHHLAISELQDLYTDHKYVVFFEGCRLLQNMIDISLDGFLLTPIQKICKYPLQLGELLKYTRTDHADYEPIANAYKCMQRVAQLVNERKRRFESLEQLITFQESFENWEGASLLDTCSLLIHSGDLTRVTSSSWSKDITLLLFDHLLVLCKKDTRILKKSTYIFKSRIDLDHVEEIISLEDNAKDGHFNVAPKNAFKFYYANKQKWYMFQAKTATDRDKWVNAFEEERRRVKEDQEQGFVVTEQDKKGAAIAHHNKLKPRKPKAAARRPYPIVKKPDTVIAEIPLGPANGFEIDRNRAGSLPSYIYNEKQAINLFKNRQSKKVRSNWFQLGSNKKNRLKRTLN